MTAPAAVHAYLDRPLSRALQHQGDSDKLARIRASHDHELAGWGLRLANLLASHPELGTAPEAEALLGLIRVELEAERREMQDAGLMPWSASR